MEKKVAQIFNSRQIGRAHVWTPVTPISRMPSSAWKKKKTKNKKESLNISEQAYCLEWDSFFFCFPFSFVFSGILCHFVVLCWAYSQFCGGSLGVEWLCNNLEGSRAGMNLVLDTLRSVQWCAIKRRSRTLGTMYNRGKEQTFSTFLTVLFHMNRDFFYSFIIRSWNRDNDLLNREPKSRS